MMISTTMCAKLNEQITAEFSAAQSYLAMACTLDGMGFKVLARWFRQQSEEERQHGMKILNYVLEVGAPASLDAVPKPRSTYSSVLDIAQAGLESENRVTRMIHDLVVLAESEKDFATRSFLTWFVDEQVEEVSSMTDLVRLVELAGPHVLQVEARLLHDLAAKEARG